MKRVLVINSSLNGESGNSHQATKKYVDSIKAKQIDVNFVYLDLSKENLSHLSSEEMQTWGLEASERSEMQTKLASISDKFIRLIEESDEIVFGVPMYNFGIPSVLKAFFDRIAQPGRTFSYTSNGPEGLLKNKKAIILAARGGKYEGSLLDTQTDYIKNFLNFIGISNINFVYLEGMAMGEEEANASWTKFNQKISELN